MEAIVIDRNFEVSGAGHNSVKASIGVVCNTEAELQFLMSHLEQFDLEAELLKSFQKIQASKEKPKLKLKKDVDKDIEEDAKNGGVGTISSLEID